MLAGTTNELSEPFGCRRLYELRSRFLEGKLSGIELGKLWVHFQCGEVDVVVDVQRRRKKMLHSIHACREILVEILNFSLAFFDMEASTLLLVPC